MSLATLRCIAFARCSCFMLLACLLPASALGAPPQSKVVQQPPIAAKSESQATSYDFLENWVGKSPREEIRPTFSVDSDEGGKLIIASQDAEAQHGWYERAFPIEGGRYYRFEALRQTSNVPVPRRSTPVRIVWQDDAGKMVRSDVPPGHENESGPIPLAEPEHPLDAETNKQGQTLVSGVYRAPSQATQAVVELHLQWAPKASVSWSHVSLQETEAPPSRKVRLATVHFMPSGKSARQNCEEYATLISKAAKQQADLVVLGETVPYVRLDQKPHETAEEIPGPSTNYFAGLAKQQGLHIVFSLYEREGKATYNTAVLLGPKGDLIGKYRKVCLPHSEVEAGVTPGKDYPVFDTEIGKIGMMICYDGFFPEVARELTNNGAEVIAWPVWGCNPLLARARACENHVYVVSSTYTNSKADWMISAVFDHAGKPIAHAKEWGDIAIAEVDLSQRHFWRNNLGDFHNMAQRHRPEPTSINLQTSQNFTKDQRDSKLLNPQN